MFVEQPRASLMREQVKDAIRKAITELRLVPGQRLIERELVEWSGSSRATVREAIRELAAEGIVQIIPQRGAIVSSPSPREAREIYDVRANLEGLAARQCAENATPAQVRALKRAFEAFKRTADSGNPTAMLRSKTRVYDAMFDGAGNTTVRGILEQLQARVTALRSISMGNPGRPAATVGEIKAIVEAIAAHDAEGAERACVAHVRAAAAIALAALEETVADGTGPAKGRPSPS